MSFLLRILGLLVLILSAVLWAVPVTRIAIDRFRYRPVELATLGDFNFSETGASAADIPPQIKILDGRGVHFIGYLHRYDRIALYLGARPADPHTPLPIQQIAEVRTPTRWLDTQTMGAVEVRGTLHVRLTRSNGQVLGVFLVDGDDVITPPSPPQHMWRTPFAVGVVVGLLLLIVGTRLDRIAKRRLIERRVEAQPYVSSSSAPID